MIDIDFSQPKKDGECFQTPEGAPPRKRSCIPSPTDHEKSTFLEQLQQISPDSAILQTTTPRQAQNTDATSTVRRRLPAPLISLCHAQYRDLQREELLAECKKVFNTKIKITEDEAQYLAQSTCLQSKSLLWFEHRKGRVTASQFGAVHRARLDSPPKALVKSILEREPSPKVAALEWGINNEPRARKEYITAVHATHFGFKVENTGLHVNPEFPHLGASPDGLVSCSCCGNGLLEVKCPYSKRQMSPADSCDGDFYLKPTENGLKLARTHKYYYQVQGQMAICKRSYCDFVCWTPLGIHIERIQWDPTHWDEVKPHLDHFFLSVVLPKLMCGDLDNKENADPKQQTSAEPTYCYCQRGESGHMIACDNQSCKIEWFHFECVQLKVPPNGDWFCPDCR